MGGGGYVNTTLGVILVLLLFFSISKLQAQDVESEFNHCQISPVFVCDTIFREDSLDYEYKPGCFLKLQFRSKECVHPWGNIHLHTEVDGFTISENSTTCHDLLDSLYPGWRLGNGTLDEVKYRSMMLGIYKYLADVRMLLLLTFGITPQQRDTDWACEYPFSPNPTKAFPYFFTAMEATCMRTCSMLYRLYTPGVGGSPSTVTRNWFFSHKKCYNTCCQYFIRYCWDTSISPPKWRRSINRANNSGTSTCNIENPNLPPLEGCIIPRGVPISDILWMGEGNCVQTCEGLYQFEHLNW